MAPANLRDLTWVDDGDRQVGFRQRCGDDGFVATAGFHGDQQRAQGGQMVDQIGQTIRIGGADERGRIRTHMDIDAILGNVYADEAIGLRRLIHHPSSSMRARAQTTVRAYGQPAGATRSLAASGTRKHSGYRPGSEGQPSNANQTTTR